MRHYEETAVIIRDPDSIFAYVDNHANFSSHMSKASWMMGGGKMEISFDEGHGQKLGSHIKLNGKAFGIPLFVDEAVTRYEPPTVKAWETVDEPKLIVIGYYKMEIELKPAGNGNTNLRVSIDYDLPRNNALMARFFSSWYAKWCVRQMIDGVKKHF